MVMTRLGFFLGCVIPTEQYAYEMSLREVLPPLGVELVDLKNASCCGSPLKNINLLMTTYLSARSIALCEKEGLDVFAPCPLCHNALSEIKQALDSNAGLKDRVNGMLGDEGLKYEGRARILHTIDLLHDEIGLEKLKEQVKAPVGDVRIAAHYGCQSLRPHAVPRPDDSENPQKIEGILKAIGAKTADYDEKLNCCGAQIMVNLPESALTKTGQKLKAVQDRGFDGLAIVCPWGQRMLDAQQDKAGETISEKLSMPVFYLTQLVGKALGIEDSKLGLYLNISPVDELGQGQSEGGD
jgi:succinate dehydrogenase / fumarate reductase cytochrome b subunit